MDLNLERFIKDFEEIARIGYEEEQGTTRLALTKEDFEARELLKNKLRNIGMLVWEDEIGNIRARRNGAKEDLPAVMCGSHIDTVPNGGKYDGLLGVMSAYEVVRYIHEKNIHHENPIEIIIFSAEESSRFNISTVGSKAITGKLKPEFLNMYRDDNEVSLYDALIQKNYNPIKIKDEIIKSKDVKAFLELHIEQGPILEKEGIDIGIVKGIAAPTRFKINLYGEEAHSGACPMDMRRDALTAASEIILEIEQKGRKESEYNTVATVGACKVFPGAMNVVPGRVEIAIDIRGIEEDSIKRSYQYILRRTKEICFERDINFKIDEIGHEKPVVLKNNIEQLVKDVSRDLGFSSKEIMSGGGHDTMNMANIVPSSLIFIPCIKGISHNKLENVKNEDVEKGIKVLYKTILELSNGYKIESY